VESAGFSDSVDPVPRISRQHFRPWRRHSLAAPEPNRPPAGAPVGGPSRGSLSITRYYPVDQWVACSLSSGKMGRYFAASPKAVTPKVMSARGTAISIHDGV
jgi:hypothetical protein